MKKLSIIVIAFALALGLTQCKKNVETITPAPTHEGQGTVFVTLTVENGSKHDVGLSGSDLGKVTFETGDFLWVLNNNQVSGKLTYDENSGNFSGYIDDDPTHVWSHFGGITLSDNDNLYFCYTSNQNPDIRDFTGMPDTPPYFVLDMSDQKDELFVVSFGQTSKSLGELKEDGALNSLSCMLENKCALVKFQLSETTAEDVVLTDVYSVCRLDINTLNDIVGATTYPEKHSITLYNPAGSSASNVRWGILMAGDSYTTNVTVDGYLCSNAITIPALANNQLYQSVSIDNTNYEPVFAISADQKVQFASGNLQYNVPTGEWRFAEHQYDFCQNDGEEWITTGWVDFFGWGTWSGTSAQWNPMKVSGNGSEYIWNGNEYFQGTIINNSETDWFTLSDEQCQYILDHNKYGMATIAVGENNVHGIVILPSKSALTIDETHDSWSDNTYTSATWTDNMEASGAVFLPATGNRIGTDIHDIGDVGIYWSRTPYATENNDHAFYLAFMESLIGVFDDFRDPGCNVRLVRNIE